MVYVKENVFCKLRGHYNPLRLRFYLLRTFNEAEDTRSHLGVVTSRSE